MNVKRELLENGFRSALKEELEKIPEYKFVSEKDEEGVENKSRYNFRIETITSRDSKCEEFKGGFGVYYIFDENDEIYYIGEGNIRDRLRDHFHGGKLKPPDEKTGNNIKSKQFREEYKIKIIVLSNEYSNELKYECRCLEQASYLYYNSLKLYEWDGTKSTQRIKK